MAIRVDENLLLLLLFIFSVVPLSIKNIPHNKIIPLDLIFYLKAESVSLVGTDPDKSQLSNKKPPEFFT